VNLKLLGYNIRFGGLGRESALAETIKNVSPDLVVFQEATHPDVIERLARTTNLPFWAARRNHSIGYISKHEIAYHERFLRAAQKGRLVVRANLSITSG